MAAAHSLADESTGALLTNPKGMVPSMIEAVARLFVTRFLQTYISCGCLLLLEEGGTRFTFEGDRSICPLKAVLRVHSHQFYWKVMTRADLGLADAYIDGDFSFTDKKDGILNLTMILIASSNVNSNITKLKKTRGWWAPVLFTAGISSAINFYKHYLRKNTLTNARRNISRHYDLSNELFALFLDETMQYSSAVFKNEDEDLKVAQLRKISILIEKARIDTKHEILEIGCGWGSFAIEVVKRTGCKYTGITLSEAQLEFAKKKVKDAGLQFISLPDQRYDEIRLQSGFMREYIFPGVCLPSLNRVTSAMTSASELCVEHLENIGNHYCKTLGCWRKNFMENQSKIVALGFDEKFIRTWEYYFEYCAAAFKSRTLRDYQIVFARPGNVAAFGNPYQRVPSEVDHDHDIPVSDGETTEPSY
ncbi:tuberculostearic acid methyltransferase UfaA1-like isoform X3 [Carya illinoinensis]|uniref:tuberculostearic acid methyltransferase UfaA1-like isoform X3 n=1 Tax=Carya illinoinensis TaxID=32201 RepID=UPI001C71CAAF|nr:tuberculostearic acid methyltransferase UfaA1-like isoform X3 [Carya illinoinensis]